MTTGVLKVKNIKVNCVFMIKVDIKGLFLYKIMYKTMTSDVTENKHSTINIWAICDLSPNLTMHPRQSLVECCLPKL